MKNFRAIRIAVTLSLILATMIQSMVGVVAAAQCADIKCSAPTALSSICNECDRCPVNGEGELCCCCKPKTTGDQPADCPHDRTLLDGDTALTIDVDASLGVCFCGLTSSPADRGHERTRTVEQIDEQGDFSTNPRAFHNHRRPAIESLATSLEIGPLPRFSQRLLCVWRI